TMQKATHDFVLAQETTDALGLRYVVDLPIHDERPRCRSLWIGKSRGSLVTTYLAVYYYIELFFNLPKLR
ncbi:hypothetical protein H8E77_05465, partial [bacterium]|nr:hypothetical protein [bacterium]